MDSEKILVSLDLLYWHAINSELKPKNLKLGTVGLKGTLIIDPKDGIRVIKSGETPSTLTKIAETVQNAWNNSGKVVISDEGRLMIDFINSSVIHHDALYKAKPWYEKIIAIILGWFTGEKAHIGCIKDPGTEDMPELAPPPKTDGVDGQKALAPIATLQQSALEIAQKLELVKNWSSAEDEPVWITGYRGDSDLYNRLIAALKAFGNGGVATTPLNCENDGGHGTHLQKPKELTIKGEFILMTDPTIKLSLEEYRKRNQNLHPEIVKHIGDAIQVMKAALIAWRSEEID